VSGATVSKALTRFEKVRKRHLIAWGRLLDYRHERLVMAVWAIFDLILNGAKTNIVWAQSEVLRNVSWSHWESSGQI
jgi:hypothetical protein